MRCTLLLCVFGMLSLIFAGISVSPLLSAVSIGVTVLNPLYSIDILAAPQKSRGPTDLTLEIYPLLGSQLIERIKFRVNAAGVAPPVRIYKAPPGIYRLLLFSPSHLKRKKLSVLLQQGVQIDFTTGTNKLYTGDVNDDNAISADDVTQISNTLRGADGAEDLNFDGIVNGIDLTIAVSNLGTTGDEL